MNNILLFIDSLGAGGAQRQLCGLACMLKDKGHNVKVVTYYNHPFCLPLLDNAHVPYVCMEVKSWHSFLPLLKEIKAFKADWVISYQTIPSFIASVCKLFGHFKLIASERNTNIVPPSWKDRILYSIIGTADHIVPNSYSQGEFIKKNFPRMGNKVTTISNFVDLEIFHPAEDRTVEPNALKMIIVASIKSSKNTKTFIEGWRIAKAKGLKMKIDWYGRIFDTEPSCVKYGDECQAIIEKYDLQDSIKLLPKSKDIDKAYREADVFCLPSLFEGTPNVICEAMASGLPVICSDICDNARYISNGENGYLFDPKNPQSIAEALLKLESESLERIYEMGNSNRTKVEQLCSPQAFVEKYLALMS